MFVASMEPSGLDAALLALRPELERAFPVGPIRSARIGPVHVCWFRSSVCDALHIYDDAIVVGEGSGVGTEGHDEPVVRAGVAPPPVPLARATTIRATGSIRPANATNVYHGASTASDSQLALAIHERAELDPVGVAVLTASGFLPGDETLFVDIRRISLWHELDLPSRRQTSIGLPRDLGRGTDAFTDHLASIVPDRPDQGIALSGGIDSRFVLGILRHAGITPTVYAQYGGHDLDVATTIAQQLELDLVRLESYPAELPEDLFTVVTDAQIRFRGARWSRFDGYVPPGSILHNGLFGEGVVKNAFKSTWKQPGPKKVMRKRLVDQVLVQKGAQGARHLSDRAELSEALLERLAYQEQMLPTERRSQASNWFFYVNRGVRWAEANSSDHLGIRPLSIMADGSAFLHGLEHGAFENLAHQRVRRITAALIPAVTVAYESGLPARPPQGIGALREKLQYEYLERFASKARANRSPKPPGPPASDADVEVASDFFVDPSASEATRRAARTIADVLRIVPR